ncbi:hypothetical protein L210DRAFT_3611346 [Boletus edulis BED1]|uniref:Ubiquitin-like protease family profile domain-containing protein n=1 Tax=Boletus edulis BED1 TaxID=1328754 RepID=A0AAD4GIG1_BOLED|nr:hypothetical protein L210DRAFT_3611346 [Boletus edulis BED1]
MPRTATRAAQPFAKGLGLHFESPTRPRDKRKTQNFVHIAGQDEPADADNPLDNDYPPVPKHRILPDQSAQRLYHSWKSLIPTIVPLYLSYVSRTLGNPLPASPRLLSVCHRDDCTPKTTSILALFFDLLVYFGLFPTAPSQPRMAVSIDLLAFYRALFERSCDAINALSSALHNHYVRRGFRIVNNKGDVIQEPFRRSLGYAVQWYDILLVEVEHNLEATLQASRDRIRASKQSTNASESVHPTPSPSTPPLARSFPAPPRTPSSAPPSPLIPRQCAQILIQRCPACFGGTTFGKGLAEGGDIHVATDGNFHHRHRRSAGDSPAFYDPAYFLPKSEVDAMGTRIQEQRKKPPKRGQSKVPDEALDSCESSYEAADGKKQKTSMESFDDTGLMALICRHDIPLFFANIDSPGEQQKYSLALLARLFSLLPTSANVIALYDVGCTLDRTISLYGILPDDIVARMRFATTAMHAYGHEWACQLVYNPRLVEGLGLTDGEGTERLWSRLIKLISIQRSSSRQRRIWLIDRQAAAVGAEMRWDLGDWIKRRLQRGVQDQDQAAKQVLDDCGVAIQDLRRQWASQKESQLSLRAHAPARLKKELDTVLALQADIDTADRAIQTAKTAIEKQQSVSDDTKHALSGLERAHERMMTKVEALYSSLNVTDQFPELQGLDLEYVRTLLLARDLKINIRKRAIASFFEWDKLDQAVGGAQKALGTKLHQRTRKAIAKRQPALMSAIRKFNTYCAQLEELHDPSWLIPVLRPLPTKLNELRNDDSLMEDVWITPSLEQIPRWMDDKNVRCGIRAVLKRDRCLEERRRLGFEADNLCRWYGSELAAVELALRTPGNETFSLLLQHCREQLLTLPPRWSSTLVSIARFNAHTEDAKALAVRLSEGTPEISLHWVTPTVIEAPEAISEEHLILPPFLEANGALDTEDVIALDYLIDQVPLADQDGEPPGSTVPPRIIWRTPLVTLQFPAATRVLPETEGFARGFLEPEDIAMLASPTSCINDVCLNNCIPLLFSAIHTHTSIPNRYAVFTTYDLPRARYKNDPELWRATKHTQFWTKDLWILPIHRPGHWVLCIADLSRRELRLFDSLAEESPWRKDVNDITSFIGRLCGIAKSTLPDVQLHFNLQDWQARPLVMVPVQTNNYDCGIWVLATVAATLRGFHVTSLTERDMPAFRAYLHNCVLSLP